VRGAEISIHTPIFTSIAIVGIVGAILDRCCYLGLRFSIHAGRDYSVSREKGGQKSDTTQGGGRRWNLVRRLHGATDHQASGDCEHRTTVITGPKSGEEERWREIIMPAIL